MSFESVLAQIETLEPGLSIRLEEIDLLDGYFLASVIDTAKNCEGSGIASIAETALLKAYYEVIERRAHRDYCETRGRLTSNGFAAHSNPFDAKAVARAEVVERHCFLACWYRKWPLRVLSAEQLMGFGTDIASLQKALTQWNVGIELVCGIIGACDEHYVAVACSIGLNCVSPFGAVFSSAASFSPGSALKKALEDQIIIGLLCREGTLSPMPRGRLPIFDPGAVDQLQEHRRFFLDHRNKDYFHWFIDRRAGNEVYQIEPPLLRVELLSSDVSAPLPAYVVRSKVVEGFDLVVGSNPSFEGMNVKVDCLNRIHPIF